MHRLDTEQTSLVTLNLKYGSSAKPLKTLAFAQLTAKALFRFNTSVKINKLTGGVASLIGVAKVSKQLVQDGLSYLKEMGKVKITNGKWCLLEDAQKEIKSDMDLSKNYVLGVLKRHFPGTIESKNLKNWFTEASADFFGHYGNECVNAISKRIKQRYQKTKTIEEILEPSIKKYNLIPEKQSLIDGFIKFLSSDDNADHQYFMLLIQALFSARLVAADVGVDLLTLEELKNTNLVLDTNVLFAISLESSRLSKSINSLEDALKSINSKLVYLNTTKEEYNRVLRAKRREVLSLIKIYPNEVIKDSTDDFIITAKSRKCKSRDDYVTFFDSLEKVPSCLPNGYEIKIEDYEDIEKIGELAESDKKLKQKIYDFALRVRPEWKQPKGEAALKHDATLLKVTDFIRKQKKKCWVLSIDKSLQACSINLAGPHSTPSVLSVPALIEILAINNAGPDVDSSNFAPLLSRIILNDCIPPINTYAIQDLYLLNKYNEKVADLPPQNIKQMVKEITKARIQGKTLDNTSLQLKLSRMFQESTMEITKSSEENKQRAIHAEEELKKEKSIRENAEEKLILVTANNIKNKAFKKLIIKLVFRIILWAILTIVFIRLYYYLELDNKEKYIQATYIMTIIGLVINLSVSTPPAINEYKKTCNESKVAASKEISENQK